MNATRAETADGANPARQRGIPWQGLRFRRLKIAYSWKCNARCSHCAVMAGPDRMERLDPDAVLRCIDDAALLGLRQIEFTGGEILLYERDLVRFMEHSRSRHLQVALDTNGFWAKDASTAASLLGRLRALGLALITLSTDVYHIEHVDLTRVLNGLAAARELDIPCRVTVCAAAGDARVLELISALYRNTPKIAIQPLASFGRAAAMDRRLMNQCGLEMAGLPCDAIDAPLVTPEGRVTLCCAPPAQFPEQVAAFSPLVLGDLRAEPLRDILRRAQADPFLSLLAAEGLYGILQRLEAVESGGHPRLPADGYCGTCDLCCRVLGSESWVRRLRDSLPAMLSHASGGGNR